MAGAALLATCGVAAGLTGSSAEAVAPGMAAAGVGLPPGSGRQVVERVCSGCHSLALVGGRRDTAKGWARTVDQMISLGATPTLDEADQIIAYLSTNMASK